MMFWRPILLSCLLCGIGQAEPAARAVLAGVRCLFPSPHDASRHRLMLLVEVKPETPGWFVSEAPSRARRIKGRDSGGNVLTSEPCNWEIPAHASEARTACFAFLLQSKISYLDIAEKLEVQMAERLSTLPMPNVSLLEETRVQAGELSFLCRPEPDNADENNREKDGSLHRAKLAVICPPGVDVLRISRLWKGGRDEETGAEVPPYSQDLDIRHSTTPAGERCAHIVLWDTAPTADLEITTCMNRCTIRVPLQCRAALGDQVPPAKPKP